MPQVVSTAEFAEKVLRADKPVMVDFFATWCGPCKALAPTLEDVEAEVADRGYVYKVDVDESPDIARSLKVMSVPTVVVFENGQVKDQVVGAHSKDRLLAMFD